MENQNEVEASQYSVPCFDDEGFGRTETGGMKFYQSSRSQRRKNRTILQQMAQRMYCRYGIVPHAVEEV